MIVIVMTQTLRLLSYNLRKNKASHELSTLVLRYNIDILCLQECNSDKLPQTVASLKLADATVTSRLGLALYYNPNKLDIVASKGFPLKRSLHDIILSPADERLLAAHLRLKATGLEFIAASFHAAPLSASNSLRRKQIASAHQLLKEFGNNIPVVMAGDYNYPLFKKKLSRVVQKDGYDLTLSNKRTYAKLVRGHFDFVTSTGSVVHGVTTLPKGASDHKPILVTVEPQQLANAHKNPTISTASY